jgi:hypothetical protein
VLATPFAYFAHFVFLRDVRLRIQRAAVASRRSTNLATHLPNTATYLLNLATFIPNLATYFSNLATYLPKTGTYIPNLA